MQEAAGPPANRRELAKALSRIANASVEELLGLVGQEVEEPAWRIGITGPPGSGKSTLIARLGRRRLEHLASLGTAAKPERLAILAIDPSSPLSSGALLGDRVRMDAIAGDPQVYVRSLGSRGDKEGLADNMTDILACADGYGFREIILETVGVGQAEHAVRLLVDSLVLVLHPDAGDTIQAMKSGIMELADIYVLNKADLPAARRTAAELNATLRAGRYWSRGGWTPPIIEVSRDDDEGLVALDQALTGHQAHCRQHRNGTVLAASRQRFHLQSLLQRRLQEAMEQPDGWAPPQSLREAFQAVAKRLAAG